MTFTQILFPRLNRWERKGLKAKKCSQTAEWTILAVQFPTLRIWERKLLHYYEAKQKKRQWIKLNCFENLGLCLVLSLTDNLDFPLIISFHPPPLPSFFLIRHWDQLTGRDSPQQINKFWSCLGSGLIICISRRERRWKLGGKTFIIFSFFALNWFLCLYAVVVSLFY